MTDYSVNGERRAWFVGSGGGLGLAGAAAEIRRAAGRGLADGAEQVFALSQERVPVLAPELESSGRTSGELKATGRVSTDEEAGRATFSYGTPYAAYIHEHMEFKHPNGGEAKFLESALVEKRDAVLEAIADRIREVTGGS